MVSCEYNEDTLPGSHLPRSWDLDLNTCFDMVAPIILIYIMHILINK
jgi:hypothetical protein